MSVSVRVVRASGRGEAKLCGPARVVVSVVKLGLFWGTEVAAAPPRRNRAGQLGKVVRGQLGSETKFFYWFSNICRGQLADNLVKPMVFQHVSRTTLQNQCKNNVLRGQPCKTNVKTICFTDNIAKPM